MNWKKMAKYLYHKYMYLLMEYSYRYKTDELKKRKRHLDKFDFLFDTLNIKHKYKDGAEYYLNKLVEWEKERK